MTNTEQRLSYSFSNRYLTNREAQQMNFEQRVEAGHYRIINREGQVEVFRPNEKQRLLMSNQHKRNVIYQSRQYGVSTLMLLKMVDMAHYENKTCRMIAHRPLSHTLVLSLAIEGVSDVVTNVSATGVTFRGGGSVEITRTVRSTSPSLLFVEALDYFSKEIQAEILEGALNAIDPAGSAYLQLSGPLKSDSPFINLVRNSLPHPQDQSDYKRFFFPWYEDENNAIPRPADRINEYFELLEKSGVELSSAQKKWYMTKCKERGVDEMEREYPGLFETCLPASEQNQWA